MQNFSPLQIALSQGVNYKQCLRYVREARVRGLKAPVILMGYYNPLLAYGEQQAVSDARDAGANGFIVVDLPPEEAADFRGFCTADGMSFVPLIAPSTTPARTKHLASLADSFIYVVSKMGVTGVSNSVSQSLPEMLEKIRQVSNAYLAVGFGVATREHFVEIGEHADGVVIGSKLVNVLKEAPASTAERAKAGEDYCASITGKKTGGIERKKPLRIKDALNVPDDVGQPKLDGVVDGDRPPVPGFDPIVDSKGTLRPPRFGKFGGQYIPEALFDCHAELEKAYLTAITDPSFWKEFESYYEYIGRPSELYYAGRLTEHAGGARIWFKREDLNHTGSHKINNAVGQILLALRLGKKRIIAETGAGQHGVATATACAKFGLPCVVYMGAEDVRRQALNVFRMKMLGAKVVAVESGSKTLKDAVNEANRDWVTNLHNTYYCIGSAIGPHPFPSLVRDFQSIIGKEIKQQMQEKRGKLPDAVIACVGGGSNALGSFWEFVEDKSVRLIGVEAGGDGLDTNRHSATLCKGTPGVLHGVKTYVLQDEFGQAAETHSISAGLDYPGVSSILAHLGTEKRAEFYAATDEEALRAFKLVCELEGIVLALESSHAAHQTVLVAKSMPKDSDIVFCASGRGDKDVEQIARMCAEEGEWKDRLGWDI